MAGKMLLEKTFLAIKESDINYGHEGEICRRDTDSQGPVTMTDAENVYSRVRKIRDFINEPRIRAELLKNRPPILSALQLHGHGGGQPGRH
jgi:hypothetical protein